MPKLAILFAALSLSCMGEWVLPFPHRPIEPTRESREGFFRAVECLKETGRPRRFFGSIALHEVLLDEPFPYQGTSHVRGVAFIEFHSIYIYTGGLGDVDLWAHEYGHVVGHIEGHPSDLFDPEWGCLYQE